MALDSVPWFTGGGAQHSPEVARTFAYTATSGSEGIVGMNDFKVTAQSTPGASVQIAPGACVVLNRGTGGSQQSYVGRAGTSTTLPIGATGSSGGRSDLIVIRVEDPFNVGEPYGTPGDVTVGPYIFARVISNVPSTTTRVSDLGLGYSAIALARIDIPSSTGTITNAMITDLRKVANPRRERLIQTWQGPAVAKVDNTANGVSGWYPDGLSVPFYCPPWATRLKMVVTLSGWYMTGSVQGSVRGEYGWNGGGGHIDTVPAGIHHTAATADRSTIVTAGDINVPADYRDKSNFVRIGTVINNGSTGSISTDTWTTVVMDLEFVEGPI